MADTTDLILALAGHCRVAVQGHGSVMLSLFATGLVGSITHCTSMCGPLVAAQSVECLGQMAPGRGGDWRRLVGAALIPYQLGRTTTYAALAAMLALPVGFSRLLQSLWWVAPMLLAAAAIGFMVLALRHLGMGLFGAGPSVAAPSTSAGQAGSIGKPAATKPRQVHVTVFTRAFDKVLGLARPLFQRPVGWRGYGLGILLGFLPCGLLYTAVMIAAATASPLAAALGMVAFALGTFPVSWLIGFGSQLAAANWARLARRLMPYLALGNALLLFGLAYRYALS